MALQLASITASTFKRTFLAVCPECGARPVAPLATGFVAKGHIEHVWSCDECRAAFATSVKFRSEECQAGIVQGGIVQRRPMAEPVSAEL